MAVRSPLPVASRIVTVVTLHSAFWERSWKHRTLRRVLHGVYGSHWAWAAKAGAHRIAATLIDDNEIPPIALAMPSDGLFGLGSGYVRHSGGDFARWILDEVPWLAAQALPAVDPHTVVLP